MENRTTKTILEQIENKHKDTTIQHEKRQGNHNYNMEHPIYNFPYNRDGETSWKEHIILEAFDLYGNHTSEYDGARTGKQFYLCKNTMEDGVTQNDLFRHLFKSLSKPDCSYVTQINKLVKEGHIPDFISIMKMRVSETVIENPSPEVIACRILNFFQIPTAYYINTLERPNPQNNKAEFEMKNIRTNIFTVDFLQEGEEFTTIKDYGEKPFFYAEEWVQSINKITENYYKKIGINIPEEQLEQQKKENMENFCYTFLARCCLMKDKDFRPKNFGMIENYYQNSIYMAPNFDMEYVFDKYTETEKNTLYKNLEYINTNCPHVLTNFIEKARELINPYKETNTTILNELLTKAGYNNEYKSFCVQTLKHNLSYIEELTNEIQSESVAEN